jgi:hypothetical protein
MVADQQERRSPCFVDYMEGRGIRWPEQGHTVVILSIPEGVPELVYIA